MNISVVLPCYNEEENIPHTIRDVERWAKSRGIQCEIIAVNDGSKDGTAGVLASLEQSIPMMRVVTNQVNQGYGAAIKAGCDVAVNDIIIFMDSDNQFHAEDISKLLAYFDRFQFVTGLRVRRADPFNRKLNAWLYGRLVRLVLGIKVHDLNCGLKGFTKELWPMIRPQQATGALFNAEMYVRMTKMGVKWGEVPVNHYPRTAGQQTGASPAVIVRMFRELFALKRSLRELHASPAVAPSLS